MRNSLLILVAAASTLACSPSQEFGLSHIPPVLITELDLESADGQSHVFEFSGSGNYELRYELRLRHGPGSSPEPLRFLGRLEIRDSTRSSQLERDFLEELSPNQVGGVLASFDSAAVSGVEPHTLSVALKQPSPDLLENYDQLRIYLKRTPRFPLLR